MNLRALFGSARAFLRTVVPGKSGAEPRDANAESLLVFASTGEVLKAQGILDRGGLCTRLMGPPPDLRSGCDMVIVIPFLHLYAALNLLKAHDLPPLQSVVAGQGLLAPVSLYMVKDYGRWLMVRAANMKLCVDKRSRCVVNVSGGGCPDVPWLAAQAQGKNLDEADDALREHGQTLCGYALKLALDEMRRLLDAKDAA